MCRSTHPPPYDALDVATKVERSDVPPSFLFVFLKSAERRRQEEDERLKQLQDDEYEREERKRIAEENKRFDSEASELSPFFAERSTAIASAEHRQYELREWSRFTQCNDLPHPENDAQLNTHELQSLELLQPELQHALSSSEKDLSILSELSDHTRRSLFAEGAHATAPSGQTALFSAAPGKENASNTSAQNGDLHDLRNGSLLSRRMEEWNRRLRELITKRIDFATANVLQYHDYFVNSRGEMLALCSTNHLRCGIWVNVHKSPRLKSVHMSSIDMSAELPRSIALSSVAVRFTFIYNPKQSEENTGSLTGLGAEVTVDLLGLPPSPKHSRGWTMRQVTSLEHSLYKLSYPMSPTHTDMTATYPEEQQPSEQLQQHQSVEAMAIAFPLPDYVAVLDHKDLRAGHWSPPDQAWVEDGISDVRLENRTVSFNTTHFTTHSLVQRRDRLLPYAFWSVRPAHQMDSAIVDVHTRDCDSLFGGSLQIEVSSNGCSLVSPSLPELSDLANTALAPSELLYRLQRSGVWVSPSKADAELAGTSGKHPSVESLACRDASLLAGTFMLASSRWNNSVGQWDCLLRIAEVADFDFCTKHDCDRRFRKERAVHSVLYKPSGCTCVDALDTYEELSESLQWQLADGRDYAGKHAKRMRVEQDIEPLQLSPSLITVLKDRCTDDAQIRVHMTDAVFTENVRQIMLGMQLFSVGP